MTEQKLKQYAEMLYTVKQETGINPVDFDNLGAYLDKVIEVVESQGKLN